MYLNRVFLIGNLTRDPELKALPSGSKVANFSVATNRTWKGQDGKRQEAVEYHNVIAFGRTAETIAQFMRKGSQLMIEGRIQTRSWDGQDGKKNYRTEIVVDSCQFGNKPKGESFDQSVPVEDMSLDQIFPDEENNEDIPL